MGNQAGDGAEGETIRQIINQLPVAIIASQDPRTSEAARAEVASRGSSFASPSLADLTLAGPGGAGADTDMDDAEYFIEQAERES